MGGRARAVAGRALAADGLVIDDIDVSAGASGAARQLVWRSSWQPVPPSPTSPADTVLPRARRRNGWNVDRDDRELRPAPLCTCGAVGRGGVICRVWQHVVRRPRCVGMDVYACAVGETFVRRVGADQLRADYACLRGHPVV